MTIWLLRHGRTHYNDQRRDQGRLDIPISPAGAAELTTADFSPEFVYVTPLRRSQQTARILFPSARQIVIDNLIEMDFGDFEGRTADEMVEDAAYRAWVDGGCTGRCPNGESRTEFCDRVSAAFAALVEDGLARREDRLVIVAHVGTLCALMERHALPERAYFDWKSGNGGGYRLDCEEPLWRERKKLRLLEQVSFMRRAEPC